MLDGSDFPKQGRKSVGSGPSVLRQAGQGGQLPGRNVPGLCQPVARGRALVDKRLNVPANSRHLGPRRAPLAVSYPAISLTTASVGRLAVPPKAGRCRSPSDFPPTPNSSPNHRACNSPSFPLPLSSRRIYVSTGGFELIGPDGGALRGTGAGSLPTLHGGIVEGTADMGTICP